MKHPLLNPESNKHYTLPDGTTHIELMERTFAVADLIGWCRCNIFKYEFRLDKKGCKESDTAKLNTYRAYLDLLESIPPIDDAMLTHEACRKHGVRLEYR